MEGIAIVVAIVDSSCTIVRDVGTSPLEVSLLQRFVAMAEPEGFTAIVERSAE